MTPTEVLKMLKSKINAAGLNKCNYAIETSDIEAINQALLLYDVINSAKIKVKVAGIGTIDKCDHCGTEFTTGVACWKVDEWKSLDLCHICLEKYYDKSK